MSLPVRKAVIPAAGLGTRFLPAAKAIPKEMLPLVDKPAIQHVVEEAVRAGLHDILIITGRGKDSLEDHFDHSFELEHQLEATGKDKALEEARAITRLANFHYVRQGTPLGLGHAVSVARHHVSGEPFAVLLGDDLLEESATVIPRMIDIHDRLSGSVVALKRMPRQQISSYGCVEAEPVEEGVVNITGLVEKPQPEEAPSDLAVMGRYVFGPEIFDALDRVAPGTGGEIQLTDGIGLLLEKQPVFGYVFDDVRYDAGNKLDYLRAVVELAMARDDVGPDFRAFLAGMARQGRFDD